MAEVERPDIPKVIGVPSEDPEEEKARRKAKQIEDLKNKVKAKSVAKKKWSSPLLQTPARDSGKSAEDTANKKSPRSTKKKVKAAKPEKPSKAPKEKPKKETKLREDDDIDDSESEGEISIPFVIEVLADSTHDDEEARAADAEKESKKHESMHNSHNALRVLERADSGKSLKAMAKHTRIAGTTPKRTRSINAQQALERVNSSKPLVAMQREVKTRERNLVAKGRKRPSGGAAANPSRSSSLKLKDAGPKRKPQRTNSLDGSKALVTKEDIEMYGEAQRKAERERRETSSRRSMRSIDEDLSKRSSGYGRSIDDSKRSRTGRSLDYDDYDDSKRSSRRNQRSIDIEWDDDVLNSKHSVPSTDVDTDAESKRKAAERRARRESHRAASQTNQVLERADSGKSLKDIANESRRRRSTSVGSHKGAHKRTNSTGASARSRRTPIAAPDQPGAPTDSLRMKEIEAQIIAEEKALKESS